MAKVPNTSTFTLTDVVSVINPGENTLTGCFEDAVPYFFNENYAGSRDRLSNFRDYGDYFFFITQITMCEIAYTSPDQELIMYRYLHGTDTVKPSFADQINRYRQKVINNTAYDPFTGQQTIKLYHRTNETVIQDYGAVNVEIDKSVSNSEETVLFGAGKSTYRILSTIEAPGQYRLKTFVDDFYRSVYDVESSNVYCPITLKRYLDVSHSYDEVEKVGVNNIGFQIYLTESIETIVATGSTGLNIDSGTPASNSPTWLYFDVYANNGRTELQRNFVVRTIATTNREQLAFIVYQKGDPAYYYEALDITPNVTYGDSNNTHYWVVKNNSTFHSYSGVLYYQIRQGDSEPGTVVQSGSIPITNLEPGQQTNLGKTWYCDSSDGFVIWFDARFDPGDSWELVETQLISL